MGSGQVRKAGVLDSRDVVYALRTIIPALASCIPDYSLSREDVFTSAARAIILFDNDLSTLSQAQREDTPTGR